MLPYDLADYCNGVGIYYACVNPTYFAEHAHPELQIAIPFNNASGLATWYTATGRKVKQSIREDQVTIIPSNQPHASDWQRKAEVLTLYLAPKFMMQAAKDAVALNSVEVVEQYGIEDLLIQQLGAALVAELQQGRLPGRLYIESLANVLTVHILRQYSASGRFVCDVAACLPRNKLRLACDYINENIRQDLTLTEIAEAVGMSTYHFARLFKQSIGVTPHQYVIQCRVARAKHLLLQGELNIAEVAKSVGFFDQSHLTKHFKRLVGVTPKTILQESKNLPKYRTNLQDH